MEGCVRTKKRGYHHGDLRTALLVAAENLIARDGALDFTLADASRMAGVSTAAPYRHFADKDELLHAVRRRGFERLTERMREALAEVGRPGTIEEFVGTGRAYVRFAIAEPAIFRLMFGPRRDPHSTVRTERAGEACFTTLLERVELFREKHAVVQPSQHDIAVALWSTVHGVATLQIDCDFNAVAPGIEPEAIVASITHGFLGQLIANAQKSG